MITVAIVDDDLEFADSLAALLELDPRIEVVGVAGTVAAGVELVGIGLVDVALIDVRMPDGGGVAVVEAVRSMDTEAGADCALAFISVERAHPTLASFDLPLVPKHELDAEVVYGLTGSVGP